jgi:uncharacterized protein YndB with AHSA1/START domain
MDSSPARAETTIERASDRELVVTRTINGPVHLVFMAWTTAAHFRQWWVPRSYGLNLVSCEMDVRVGGEYRLTFLHDGSTMEFFGTYTEVVSNTRLVWTNDEGEAGTTVTTVTFEAVGSATRVVLRDLYPSAEALDAAGGSTEAMPEAFAQLDELLASLSATET